mgnify:CR=1 FL=1
MFCIKTGTMTAEDLNLILLALVDQDVRIRIFAKDKEDPSSTFMVVDELPNAKENSDEAYMVELGMQFNFRQVGWICPYCEMHAGQMGQKTCGHLTFAGYIDSSAFDRALGMG